MKTFWNPSVRSEIASRVAKVEASTESHWGSMTASEMLAHLEASLEMAMGRKAVASKKLPLRYPPLKQLVLYWLPFPKGAPTAPELRVTASPEEHAAVRARLERLVAEWAGLGSDDLAREHPAFGTMSSKAWGVLVYRHADHHLRQFGV